MTRAKQTDIVLAQASAKFTKAKAAVDGTAKAEAAYRKAKSELAFARQAHAETRTVPARPGDGQVRLKSVAAKAGNPKTRSND